jgi:hypothetical protein
MTRSQLIDKHIAEITDWRGKTFAQARKAILAADPEIVEEYKWMGTPTWERYGILLVGDAYKGKVKFTFANGAHLADPDKLFNNGFGGKKWRAIDLHEGDKVNERALTKLIRAAIAFNQNEMKERAAKKAAAKKSPARKAPAKKAATTMRATTTRRKKTA